MPTDNPNPRPHIYIYTPSTLACRPTHPTRPLTPYTAHTFTHIHPHPQHTPSLTHSHHNQRHRLKHPHRHNANHHTPHILPLTRHTLTSRTPDTHTSDTTHLSKVICGVVFHGHERDGEDTQAQPLEEAMEVKVKRVRRARRRRNEPECAERRNGQGQHKAPLVLLRHRLERGRRVCLIDRSAQRQDALLYHSL